MPRSPAALIVTAIALGAAGCFADHGVAIEVDVGDTKATTVELYVGNRLCSDADDPPINCKQGIAPPMVSAHLAGTVWFRDDLVPYIARVKGGKATFRLQSDAETTLPIVIAVGTTASAAAPTGIATLHDVVVPVQAARVLTTRLTAAAPVQPESEATTEERVQVWTQPTGSSCVVVERWVDGKATRDFIVPGGDPDCDSVDRECDPAAANGALTRDGIDRDPQCLVPPIDSATQACRLGAFGCSDATGPTDKCLTTRDQVCVPLALCECRGPDANEACTLRTIGDPESEGVPHLACTVRLSLTGTACKDTSPPLDLNGHLGTRNCVQPELSSFELEDLDNRGKSHSFGGVDLELTSPDNQCRFKVQVNSGGRTEGRALGLVRLAVVDERAVLLPIIFTFTTLGPPCLGQGQLPMECKFVEAPADPMWTCVP